VSKTYRAYEPKQSFLLPPSPMDWLPEGHLAYFILDVVKELDLRAIHAFYEQESRGQPPHHPEMMVALLLYAYCVGIPSSRKIERRTYEDVAFRVLTGGQHPDHTRISEFRRIHGCALSSLFVQVLKLCQKAGLVKLGHVAIDGTKIKANASKHKAMSYEHMTKKEAELKQKVEGLLRAAEQADREEDAEFGVGVRGDELPAELQRAESRLAAIRRAKAELEAEARQQAEKRKSHDDGDEPPSGSTRGSSSLPSHRIPADENGVPKPKAQRNFTDPESRIQKATDEYLQGFNAQAAVDEAHQIIVAQAVTNQPPDAEHLLPMLDLVEGNCGRAPTKVSADAGYLSEQNLKGIGLRGVDPYIAPGRFKHGQTPPSCRGRPRANMTAKERMARKLGTKGGAAVYSRRKAIVEPIFGQIKEARGFRRFLQRGLQKVRAEWSLICATHNLLKLFRAVAAV
jgi:transposase